MSATDLTKELPPDAQVMCQNCVWQGTARELKVIEDIGERIAPCEIVPAGECPECGALAKLMDDPTEGDRNALLEDAAAISAVFHQDKRWQKFYDAYGPALSGFPGLWQFCAFAAERFHAASPENWDHHDWIACLDRYVDSIFEEALSPENVQDNRPSASLMQADQVLVLNLNVNHFSRTRHDDLVGLAQVQTNDFLDPLAKAAIEEDED